MTFRAVLPVCTAVILLSFTPAIPFGYAGESYADPTDGWRYIFEANPFPDGVVDANCVSGICPPGFGGTFANTADFNTSNAIDGTDFLIWQRGLGTTTMYPAQVPKKDGNANNDQAVDGLDLATWQWQYGVNPVTEVPGTPPTPGFEKKILALDGTWKHDQGDKWDGTAPGDPLSDPTVSADPIISLTGKQGTSPGGAGVFAEGNTSYLRLQDAGNPEVHGWIQALSDPNLTYPSGPPAPPTNPINTNRRVYFGHDMTQDGPLDSELIMTETGTTISFRARIPNSGPLDDVYLETDGDDPDSDPDVIPWFQDAPHGRGKPLQNGRGTINVVQNDPTNIDTSVSFSVVNSTDIAGFCDLTAGSGSLCSGTGSGGLIMNNLVGNVPSNNIDSESAGDLNILEMSDSELNQWNEFWITLENNGPIDGNIEVNVYMNGSTTPAGTFQVTLAAGNNAVYSQENNPFLDFGSSDTDGFGSIDIDFLSYKLGVHLPVAAGAAGAAGAAVGVPEPASCMLVLLGGIGWAAFRRR